MTTLFLTRHLTLLLTLSLLLASCLPQTSDGGQPTASSPPLSD